MTWELTPENALGYLRRQGWVDDQDEPVTVEALAGGVSAVVLRVALRGGRRLMVLKQSRPRLRTREEWFSDVGRIHREQEVMELLGPLLPPGVIPRVLHADRER